MKLFWSFTVVAVLIVIGLMTARAIRDQAREFREYEECQQTPGCIWQ